MPVIPSFGKFAQTPNAGAAYVGGAKISADAASDAARIQVQRESIAAEAAQAASRISLGYAQIAAESVQNQMQLEAKNQIVAQQAMKQAQEAEIEKAYRETQLGMAERELKNDEAITNMRLQEAARGFEASQTFNRVYQSELASGKSEADAQRSAARSAGPTMPGFGEGIGGGNSRAAAPQLDAATKSSIKLMEADIGEHRRELLRTDDPEEKIKLQGRINKLTGRLQRLFPIEPPSPGAIAEPSPQQWQVNPESIPFGAPSGFIGTPGGANQFNGAATPTATRNTQQTLKILSVRKKQ